MLDPTTGLEQGIDPVKSRKNDEQRRQHDEEFTRLYRLWSEIMETGGWATFVGYGSRWYSFAADAELLAELKLVAIGRFTARDFNEQVAYVNMHAGERRDEWLKPLLAEGYQARFVLVANKSNDGDGAAGVMVVSVEPPCETLGACDMLAGTMDTLELRRVDPKGGKDAALAED